MSLLEVLSPTQRKISRMREAAKLTSNVLLELEALTKPGVSLAMLDELAERMILEAGGTPYNKGYHPAWAKVPFPSTVCCSVNEEICHAPAYERTLQEGDIVKYDLGVKLRGWCGDAALTVGVGEISNRKARTMRYAKRILYNAIRVVKPGVPISEIGKAIEASCLMYNYRVFKQFGGHHIGREMHEKPSIPNHYLPQNDDILLKENDVICIEPHITPGKGTVGDMSDGWTTFALDEQPVAMYEHMVLITKDGFEILTDHIHEDVV